MWDIFTPKPLLSATSGGLVYPCLPLPSSLAAPLCQQNKVNHHPTCPLLSPISSSTILPFKQLSVDLITDLPLSSGHDSLMVVVDHSLMKGVILAPCSKNIDAAGIAQLFLSHIFKCFGLHDSLTVSLTEDCSLPLHSPGNSHDYSTMMSASPLLIILKLMEKLNEPIRRSKPISESFVPTTLRNGWNSSPLPNSTTTPFLIAP